MLDLLFYIFTKEIYTANAQNGLTWSFYAFVIQITYEKPYILTLQKSDKWLHSKFSYSGKANYLGSIEYH